MSKTVLRNLKEREYVFLHYFIKLNLYNDGIISRLINKKYSYNFIIKTIVKESGYSTRYIEKGMSDLRKKEIILLTENGYTFDKKRFKEYFQYDIFYSILKASYELFE